MLAGLDQASWPRFEPASGDHGPALFGPQDRDRWTHLLALASAQRSVLISWAREDRKSGPRTASALFEATRAAIPADAVSSLWKDSPHVGLGDRVRDVVAARCGIPAGVSITTAGEAGFLTPAGMTVDGVVLADVARIVGSNGRACERCRWARRPTRDRTSPWSGTSATGVVGHGARGCGELRVSAFCALSPARSCGRRGGPSRRAAAAACSHQCLHACVQALIARGLDRYGAETAECRGAGGARDRARWLTRVYPSSRSARRCRRLRTELGGQLERLVRTLPAGRRNRCRCERGRVRRRGRPLACTASTAPAGSEAVFVGVV